MTRKGVIDRLTDSLTLLKVACIYSLPLLLPRPLPDRPPLPLELCRRPHASTDLPPVHIRGRPCLAQTKNVASSLKGPHM